MAERVSIHGCSARRCSHPAPTCGQTVDSCTLSARPIAQDTDCKSGGGGSLNTSRPVQLGLRFRAVDARSCSSPRDVSLGYTTYCN